MKKFLMIAMSLVCAVSAWADCKLTSGTMSGLKNADARVLVTWNYDNLKIEDKTPQEFLKEKGADWEKDYAAETVASQSAFDMEFNKKDKKYAQITDDDTSAGYEFIINLDELHYGSTATAIIFGGFSRGAVMKGTIDLKDLSNNKTVATMSFDCSGDAAYGNEARRVLAYQDLAKDLAKLVKKGK